MRAIRSLAVLLMTLAVLITARAVDAAGPIVNTARLSWTEAGQAVALSSNTVSLDRAVPPVITVFRADPTVAVKTVFTTPLCGRTAAALGTSAAASQEVTQARGLVQTGKIHAGEVMYFSVLSPASNRDPAAVDTISGFLITPSGDRETLTVFESGPDTGEFIGSIATRIAPPVVAGDCVLSLREGDQIMVESKRTGNQTLIATATVEVLIDPFGLTFDAEDGTPIDGTTISLVDADTGRPANVFAPDGVTPWPSTVVTGQTVRDAAGVSYPLPPGEYWFPFAAAGRYRFVITPPAPYSAPSAAIQSQLAGLVRPDGGPLAINPGSYAGTFVLSDPAPVRIDVPLDRPPVSVSVTKTASAGSAAPGDLVRYVVTVRNPDTLRAKRGVVVTDILPAALRLRPDTIRRDGAAAPDAVTVAADGRTLTVALGTIAAGATHRITYALQVRADAREGQALNRAVARDSRGLEGTASVAIRITRQSLGQRMTLIGRIVAAPCSAKPPFAHGVAGVRVLLEDGSYAVTDTDGRYHFEGLRPGTHVVQVDPATLPAGGVFADCERSTRSAGSAISRFVTGQGGTLAVADFHAVLPDAAPGATAGPAVPVAVTDRAAAGAERDWFADRTATIAWLFPEADHNPRASAVRVAIRHLPGQKVALFADGKPVDPVTLDGSRTDPDGGGFAVSLWRGVPLNGGTTRFTAEIRNPDGSIAMRLERPVHFTNTAAAATLLRGQSRLIADGVARPVVAVRLVDRAGRPLHGGSVGEVELSAPYVAAQAIDAEQQRMLAGLERARPTWRVAGDDGVAEIQLAPTTASGQLTLTFTFRDGDRVRRQTLETWLEPGDQPWTLVGLAEGRLGKDTLGKGIEPLDRDPGVLNDGRVAFYAKGRIRGRWLLTLAYDSDKRRDAERLGGTIDPDAYYTVYADRSERRFDAASTRKLYVRLETRAFRALFGDFETELGETELGRYQRAATGLKADWRGKQFAATAFAARVATRHRRDELQGNGLTGPYALRARDVVANSERVELQVRDRLRSEQVIERRTLTRYVDYDIDYAAGALRFTSPVLSRTSALDPQFVVVDYEVEPTARADRTNAGARVSWRSGERVRIGATVLSDAGDAGRTELAAVDAKVRLSQRTEARAEAAVSRNQGETAAAWQAELEHHDAGFDVLAYVRQQDAGFGVAQQNAAERGRRKLGVDARVRLNDSLSLVASGWTDRDLSGPASRNAAKAQLEYRDGATQLRAGLTYAADHTIAGRTATSTLIEASGTRQLFDNRLELEAATSIALDQAESVDFPAQHRLGARYRFSHGVALVGAYEIAEGETVSARTARIGFDLKPWAGARLTSSVADQALGEYGRRAFAAYGLAQSLQLGKSWSVDASLDGARTLGGIDPADVVNPAHPVAAGGVLGPAGAIAEDFTALTVGATWRRERWSATGRGEYRWGDVGDRAAVMLSVIRQLDAGMILGGRFDWTRASAANGVSTETLDAVLSFAGRPATSSLAWLGKLEWRQDSVAGAITGAAGPVGGALLTVDGDARSRRLLGSMSVAWAPWGRDEAGQYRRHELQLFLAGRYVAERFDDLDIDGVTTLAGLDARIGLGENLELGVSGTVRGDLGEGTFTYALGPVVGVRPATNTLLTLGWNVTGFADRDFAAERTTRDGPFVALRMKFDQGDFARLGLGR